ncbi:hypothetical protein B0H19DRAFT_1261974 [Mycena capillaripes]|nr:hypothetical protein B0H19DRAFT_1261937 [Mycena capillaripes]KAJ6555822.1 hypothetical protein B0H19DRAFT_1261974 [Mycena capillaripes]
MDYESNAGVEFTSNSSFRQPEHGSHSSGMFSGARNLAVNARTLTNITHYTTASVVPTGLVGAIQFEIIIYGTGEELPAGFLFLCPTEDFQIGPVFFWWPDCPAYWSLDPLGVEHPTAEEATELGFPSLQLNITVFTRSWDATVYAGVRQFHKAKGFDLDSQDVARSLGQPLYELSGVTDVPFAHGDDEHSCAEEDNEDELSMDLSWCE